MRLDAFITTNKENKLFDVLYYHMPIRWSSVNISQQSLDSLAWSDEIKFLADNGFEISERIKLLPETVGGIYIFFIKGIILPEFETYLAYIGRAQYTDNQNLRKRCHSYYYEFFKKDRRPKIAGMIENWGKYLYLRYAPLTDNTQIIDIEKRLINGILPPFNDEIPDIVYKLVEDAFSL